MKRIIFISALVIASVVVLISLSLAAKSKANRITVESIGAGKGVFVGEKRPQYQESDPTKWSPETRQGVEEYERDIKAMDLAHNYTMMALNSRKAGSYEEAIQYHKKAYDVYPPGRSTVRIDLVETYELMGKYEEAITTIDIILEERYLSEWGKKAALAMRQKLRRRQNSEELPTDKPGWPMSQNTGFKRIEGRWYPDIEKTTG